MKYNNIQEEELKNKVGQDWFPTFDTTEIIGKIDFTVFSKKTSAKSEDQKRQPLLWAEAKTGNYDTVTMFVQLILTIGKARTFDKFLPPTFLGAFDFQKMAFVEYSKIQDIFYKNDFNWNVTPSDHNTKEFKEVRTLVKNILKENTYIFDYEEKEKELKNFIKNNISKASTAKIKIDKNNFISIYLDWLNVVKPLIETDWDALKREQNILDSDFYLADLFVNDNNTDDISDDVSIRESLFVTFQNKGYKIKKEDLGQLFDATVSIKNIPEYQNFWKHYKRPPLEVYQDYIIERRDMLVPQDIRERKGAYFTPQKWVKLSQKYMADYFGENYQDEYYIWDCAAGTGNLLAGLVNKYNIYASTLDIADVKVMHERIDNGTNLLKNHCFQFDFLNDDFLPESKGGKLPDTLYDIINDEQKRKKLIIYINPPYAEAGNVKQRTGTGENKEGTAINNKTYAKYKPEIKKASNELFAQFLIRIYKEIPKAKIANFSTLKNLQSSNFQDFRAFFRAKLEKIFLAPADTFDNVKGQFPIGFFIWNTEKEEPFTRIRADVYDSEANKIGRKNIYSYDDLNKRINQWITKYRTNNTKNSIGTLVTDVGDFQNQTQVYISDISEIKGHKILLSVCKQNIFPIITYFAVRHCIEADWLNDRDQFLHPIKGWETDTAFHADCLAFTLFHGQNRISSAEGTNHWIPFTEEEVQAQERFNSHFMTDFITGKLKPETPENKAVQTSLFPEETTTVASPGTVPLTFSDEAQAVFDAGKALWQYYHKQKGVNVNASLYDIRKHFQGVNDKGRMNTKSDDESYTKLVTELRKKLKALAKKIEPKVYQYKFLIH